MKYELYGEIHREAKRILHRSQSTSAYRMISINKDNIDRNGNVNLDGEPEGEFLNEFNPVPETVVLSDVYPVENIVQAGYFPSFNNSFSLKHKCNEGQLGVATNEAETKWLSFINNSAIPENYRNAGLHYGGYILDAEEWCLPSWIWTNAALVRMYCKIEDLKKAEELTDLLLEKQQESGGWIVRNDYDSEGAVPVLAPNDSAYVANNACLELYIATGEEKYLDAAVRCADWIIKTAREDGMIYVGYDVKRRNWQTKHNIVDVGFAAALFARLYEISKEQKYLDFLEKFVKRYIQLFYMPSKHGFATSLNENDEKKGGMFGRGQAWALEGLVPSAKVLRNEKIDQVITDTITNLIKMQDKTGGWAYNLSRPLMGIDCKATSIIALSLWNWHKLHPDTKEIKSAAQRAYNWCLQHTMPNGRSEGGIFSYSVEGAIVHHMYTWTAFVYASSYAIELGKALSEV